MATTQIVVDRSRCTGIGVCESIAPDHFEIDEDGNLVVVQADVQDDDRSSLEEAVSGCPTAALRLGTP